ncbi:MAG: AAA family ATPase [Pirellulales bacterium]|nr:AAA family ATPase [Pirellulales bacterium]
MYEAYFDFGRRPFPAVPQADQYFPASAIETARQTLARCIERGAGAAMVVGPSGTGKTLLCQVLAQQWKDSFPVVLLSSGRLSTRRALLQAILYGLGQPYRGMDEGELRLALVEHLTTHEGCPHGILLLVDEAHTLPLRLLDEIRMLTNVTRDAQPSIRLVLCGACMLEERFASPKLDSFSQRLVARCYLEAFNGAETQSYVQTQINSSGGAGEPICSDETCRRIHQVTDGVPRLINQVCDHALLLAYVAGRHHLEPNDVEEAWADLQQLPPPRSGQTETADAGDNVIEFGGLEDQPGDVEHAADEEPALPPLRISPEDGEADLHPVEPAEQLDQIEQMLEDVEEEFQPAGSIGPEVELVFDEPSRPFREPFEREEIVADRAVPSAGPQTDQIARVEQTEADYPPEPEEAAETGAFDWAAGSPDEPGAAADWEVDRRTVPMRRRGSAAMVDREDSDLLVAEQEDDEGLRSAAGVGPVRGHAYGRLFAKLRRG